MSALPPCQRCGTFTEASALVEQSGQRVCPTCAARTADVELYPYAFVLAIGMLFNFVPAFILASMNAKKLGDEKLARSLIQSASVVGPIFMLAALLPLSGSIFIGTNMGLVYMTLSRSKHQLFRASGPSPGLVMPFLASVAFTAACVGALFVLSWLIEGFDPR